MNQCDYLGVYDGKPQAMLNNWTVVDLWHESMGWMEYADTTFGFQVEDWAMGDPQIVITNERTGQRWIFDYNPSAMTVNYRDTRTARKSNLKTKKQSI